MAVSSVASARALPAASAVAISWKSLRSSIVWSLSVSRIPRLVVDHKIPGHQGWLCAGDPSTRAQSAVSEQRR